MKMKFWSFLTVACMLVFSGPASAQDARLILNTCLSEGTQDEEGVLSCIDEALNPCLTQSEDMSSVATLCFIEARGQFDEGISSAMGDIRGRVDEQLVVLMTIGLKYDMLSSLLQCDRLEELAIALSELSGEIIQRQKAQCLATTSGLALARVTSRAAGLD
ncbi:hypothetical protein LSUCC0387_04400 [Rhodobacterales bacterium LSUCC0387]|nr:hypothetical protein [Rhodobacterales bacterium LSUCC0387]